MKKLLTVLTLAAALCTGGTASAVTLYSNGVTYSSGLTLSALASDGWSTLLDVSYATGHTYTDVLDWQTAAGSNYVFVGAADLQGNIIVGATGLASEVMDQTFSGSSATLYGSSNLYWYNAADLSFGFTPTQQINLTSADTYGLWSGPNIQAENDLRLSWHNHSWVGGWRAGSISGLNDSNDYRKIILVGDGANVPDSGSMAGLLGLGAVALAALRRRRA